MIIKVLVPSMEFTASVAEEMWEWAYVMHFTTKNWKYPLDVSVYTHPKFPSHTVVWRVLLPVSLLLTLFISSILAYELYPSHSL